MLTLSLLRHAKSSWKNPTLPDRERPLATRGVTDAPLMGRTMTEHGIDPDLVLCSSWVGFDQTGKDCVGKTVADS